VVVDYKTNRLTRPGAAPGPDDYAPDRLTQAMADHHYPLQALLYSVALHRYLRWRLSDYDPEVHLGGIAYLFVRGMVGADTPVTAGQRHGVFSWAVPAQLVTDLSDLLAGRRPGDDFGAGGAR
jgi:exodeoxyribonuclease V beta subunit